MQGGWAGKIKYITINFQLEKISLSLQTRLIKTKYITYIYGNIYNYTSVLKEKANFRINDKVDKIMTKKRKRKKGGKGKRLNR